MTNPSGIVVLSGNPRPGSRTVRLATALADQLSRHLHRPVTHVVDLADYGHSLLIPDAEEVARAVATVRAARLLVVATPTYKGTYTGVLKVFADRLPPGGLAGITATTVVTSAAPGAAEVATAHLRTLLGELGAAVAAGGLNAHESQLDDPDTLAAAHVGLIADAVRAATGVPEGELARA